MSRWNQAQVQAIKVAVKEELDREGEAHDQTARLNLAIRIVDNKDVLEGDAQLRCLIGCISAVVHHVRFGGLDKPKLNLLEDIARQVLQVVDFASVGSE